MEMIRTSVCLIVLAVTASILLTSSANGKQVKQFRYNFTFGDRIRRDELVFQDVIKIPARQQYNSSYSRSVTIPDWSDSYSNYSKGVWETVNYPVMGLYEIQNASITAVCIHDLEDRLGLYAAIVEGGIKHKNVTVQLYSEQSQGLSASVKVYALPN